MGGTYRNCLHQKNSFPGEEKPLHNSWPDQEHSPGGRCMCVSQQSREDQNEYRGFTTRCKPLVSLKIRKTRLEFAKKHLKKPLQFCNNILWTDETKINLYQNYGKRRVWRRKGTAHDSKHTTSSVKHGGGSVMAWACTYGCQLVPLYFLMMWLLTKAARWILKCFRQYYLLIFSQMLQNSLDSASQCRWTMTRSILRKQPNSFLRQRSGMLCNAKSITWPESDWACISLAEDKTEGKGVLWQTSDGACTCAFFSRGTLRAQQDFNPSRCNVLLMVLFVTVVPTAFRSLTSCFCVILVWSLSFLIIIDIPRGEILHGAPDRGRLAVTLCFFHFLIIAPSCLLIFL